MIERLKGFAHAYKLGKYFVTDNYSMSCFKYMTNNRAESLRREGFTVTIV